MKTDTQCKDPLKSTRFPVLLILPVLLLGIDGCERDRDGDGWTVREGDCEDQNPDIHPEAHETCDGVDNDCDGSIDDGASTTFYVDADDDGYGDPDLPLETCVAAGQFVQNALDCEDSDASIHPGAAELCDRIDNDCDGRVDDLSFAVYRDADADGYGDETESACLPTHGYIPVRGDCDDGEVRTHPGAADGGDDGIDQDCGGTDGTDPHVGLSPLSDDDLQSAIDAAQSGATIWVGPGTWSAHDLTFGGKAVTLISTHGAHRTVIDAAFQGRVMRLDAGEGLDTVIDGLTLTRGLAPEGAGLYIHSSSPRIEGCIIAGNVAMGSTARGGGIYLAWSSALLSRCSIIGNHSSLEGGGLAEMDSSPILTDCTITGNRAMLQGGGLYLTSSAELTRCDISENSATFGAGAYLTGAAPRFTSSRFLNNSATQGGGGLFILASSPVLTQSLITGNDADFGAGIAVTSPEQARSAPYLLNSILAYNRNYNLYEDTPVSVLEYCDLYNPPDWENHTLWTLGSTNVTVEPRFLAYTSERVPSNLHLAIDSPLIDMGTATWNDLDGSRSDPGTFGGPQGGLWDRDQDGVPDYFWPGTLQQAPDGFDPAAYDCDDTDATVQRCDGGVRGRTDGDRW